MKVHELMEKLSKAPQFADVILSSDPEGNSYDIAYEVAVLRYDPTDEIYPIDPDDLDDHDDVLVGFFIWP